MNGTQMLEHECREQPARLRALIAAYKNHEEIRRELRAIREAVSRSRAPVIFIGMGGSLCASINGSTHLQSNGRPAFSVDAGEWLHYARPVWKDAAVSVLVTASGESAELVEFMKQDQGGPTALICNNPASPCWKLAQSSITDPCRAGIWQCNEDIHKLDSLCDHSCFRNSRPCVAEGCRSCGGCDG